MSETGPDDDSAFWEEHTREIAVGSGLILAGLAFGLAARRLRRGRIEPGQASTPDDAGSSENL